MKTEMKKLMMLSLVALVAMTMTSCMHVKIGDKDWSLGSHTNDTPTQVHQVGKATAMSPFDQVDVAGPFNVILEQGDSNTVRVEGTTEQLSKITIYVKDGSLYIDQRKQEDGNIFNGMQIFVTCPMVKGIEIAGSGTVTTPQALNVKDIYIEVAGSGRVTLAKMTAQDVKCEIAGSGDITIGMLQANEVRNEIAGSGNIDIAGLTCKNVKNEIAGSGDIVLSNINVDHVKTEIAGSGDVTLLGKIGTHDEDIAGSGKVHINE